MRTYKHRMTGITKERYRTLGMDPSFEWVAVDKFAFVRFGYHAKKLYDSTKLSY